jgi:hypothetical protein
MLLGTILKRLGQEADAGEALAAMGDMVLLTEVQAMGELHDETPAEYVCGATRRFAADASSEEWLALMTAVERGADPARATLERMLRWALARDAAEARAGEACGHGCGCGHGGAGHAA